MLSILKTLFNHLIESGEENSVLFFQIYFLTDLFILVYYLYMSLP
jgi:hypothetical protein